MSIQECLDCPSALTKDEAEQFFGLGAMPGPMCGRYGYVLGAVKEVAKAASQNRSKHCTFLGDPLPSKPSCLEDEQFAVAYEPRPELLNVSLPSDRPLSCTNCKHLDSITGACAAKGKIIFPSRVIEEAGRCPFGIIKSSSGFVSAPALVGDVAEELRGETWTEVELLARRPSSSPKTTPPPKADPVKLANIVKHPRNFDSDALVEDEHKGIIRAFRKVDTRFQPVYLPIFETDYFGDRAELIPDPHQSTTSDPSLYVDHAGLLEEFAVQCYVLDMNLALTGEPGTGKTEGANYLAWMLNMPFVRLAYTSASEPDHFLGTPQYSAEKGTYFQPGLLPRNWTQPTILLSDEMNLPEEAIQEAYRSMNDSARLLQVYGNNFYRHDYCFHLGAMNPAHDFRNLNAKPFASANSSRWSWKEVPNPTEEQVRGIIARSFEKLEGRPIDKNHLNVIVKIGEDLREASRQGELPDFWTLRQELKVARLIPYFGVQGAYDRAYFFYADPATRALGEKVITSIVPPGADWA